MERIASPIDRRARLFVLRYYDLRYSETEWWKKLGVGLKNDWRKSLDGELRERFGSGDGVWNRVDVRSLTLRHAVLASATLTAERFAHR